MDQGKHGRVFLELGHVPPPPYGNEMGMGEITAERAFLRMDREILPPVFCETSDSGISIFEGYRT
jgi:hypothetical protein